MGGLCGVSSSNDGQRELIIGNGWLAISYYQFSLLAISERTGHSAENRPFPLRTGGGFAENQPFG